MRTSEAYLEHLESFSRFIETLTMELRISRDTVSGTWIAALAMLAKCMAASAGPSEAQIQAALNEFLAGASVKLAPAFKELLGAMSQDDEELGEAIRVLSDQLIDRLLPSDFGIVRNALAHSQMSDLVNPEVRIALGDAFIGRPQARRGMEGGDFLVPRTVGQLVVQLAQAGREEVIQVPFSGLGSLLVEAYRQDPTGFSTTGPVRLIGCERNQGTWARGVLILRLYGIPRASMKTSAMAIPLVDGQPNVVISCPPFGSADKEAIQAMRFAIPAIAGNMPDQALRDFAGVFQIVLSLKPEERAVVVVNPALLFRVGAVARLRSAWVDEDLLEAVISLPAGLMQNTAMATNIVIFNMHKAADRAGLVLFIAADEMGRTKGAKKLDGDLFQEEMAKIVSAYQAFKDVPGLAKVIDGFDLGDQGWNLIPARYVVRVEEQDSGPDLNALHASLAVAEGLAAQARTRLDQTIDLLLTGL